MTDKTEIHASGIDPAHKQRWLDSARIAGMPFDDWVTQALDAQAVETQPEWTKGLSDRARIAVLFARFGSREAVAAALDNDYSFVALPNAGRIVDSEVREWLMKC